MGSVLLCSMGVKLSLWEVSVPTAVGWQGQSRVELPLDLQHTLEAKVKLLPSVCLIPFLHKRGPGG